MGQILASVAGALLLLKFVKILLPEGSIKNYASISVSALVVLVMIASVTGKMPNFSFGDEIYTDMPEGYDTGDVMNAQIMKEFSRRLEEDMKTAVPALSECELEFVFSEKKDGSYFISSVVITSHDKKNTEIIMRICELYSIDDRVISWRTK